MSCESCGAVNDAVTRLQKEKRSQELKKLLIICGAAIVCALTICATVLACYTVKWQQETILEQQYALNMQYASLMEYVSGAEIVTEYADSGDNGTAIVGDGNMVSGGDVNNG